MIENVVEVFAIDEEDLDEDEELEKREDKEVVNNAIHLDKNSSDPRSRIL